MSILSIIHKPLCALLITVALKCDIYVQSVYIYTYIYIYRHAKIIHRAVQLAMSPFLDTHDNGKTAVRHIHIHVCPFVGQSDTCITYFIHIYIYLDIYIYIYEEEIWRVCVVENTYSLPHTG